jgi:eukaryotic-like serine/threonine-protein kinase
MEESEGSGFDEFFVEMEESEYVKIKKFDRMLNFGEGGSFAQEPLIHDGNVYVASLDRNVYALSTKTGDLIWSFRAEGGIVGSSPVIGDGVLYVGSYDQNLYALDAKTGRLVWKFHTMGKIVASATLHEGKVYFGSSDYNAYCLDAKSGELIWKFKTYGETMFKPTIHDGKVFFGSNDQFLYCLDARSGKLIWKHETQGEIFCQNALLIHEGVVYFPSFDNFLRAADVNTGSLIWKFKTGSYGGMASSPFFYKGVLYQPNREGVLWALTPDGRELWNFRIPNAMSHPLVHDDRIYIGTDRNLYCLSLSGKKLWSFETQGEIWWRPAVWNGMVYFASFDCHLYCVDIATHELSWKFRARGEPSYMPPPFDSFELSVKKHVEDSDFHDVGTDKRYAAVFEEDDAGKFYKSKVTYRMSTQYSAKGKYQKDSDEEAL